MMKMFCVLALGLCAAHLSAAEGAVKMICFGDSIVEGKTPAGLQASERWPDKVEAASGYKLRCINEGKGGRATTALLELGPALKRTPEATMLLIALGTNDSRDYKAGNIGRVTLNLMKMIEIARTASPEIEIVLCAPYNINANGIQRDREMVKARVENLV